MKILFRRSKLPVTTLLDSLRGSGLPSSMYRCAPAILAGVLGLLQLGCAGAPSMEPASLAVSPGAVAPAVESGPPRLEPGHALERDLAGGRTDELALLLEADQYVRLSIDQKRIDVAATLLDPSGEAVAASDGPGLRKVPELLSLVTRTPGEYRLVVKPHDPGAEAGHYRVALEEVRPGRPEDGGRVRAEALLSEAAHLELSGDNANVPLGLTKAEEALTLWRRIGDPAGEVRTLTILASLQYRNNDTGGMAASLNEALSRALAARDERGEAEASWMLAAFTKLDRETGARYLDRALEIQRKLGETGGQAKVLYERGFLEYKTGKSMAAVSYWQEALPLAEQAGENSLAADIWNGIGTIYSNRGEGEKAWECHERALGLAQLERNRGAEAAALTSMGLILRRRGEPQSALTRLGTALKINQREDSRRDQGFVLLHLGGVYTDLGDAGEALKRYEEALGLFRSIEEKSAEGLTLANIGQVYSELKEWRTALGYFEQARLIFLKPRNDRRLGLALHNIGVARLKLGRTAEAIQSLEEALPLRREAGDRLGEASTLVELGGAYQAQGKPDHAATLIRQGLEIGEQAEASFVQASALLSLARIERDRGQLPQALVSIERSLHILERTRSNLAGDRLRSSFFASRRSYYDFYVDLLMRLGHEDRALEASERARARSLLDLLAEGRLDLTRGISPELKRQETNVNARLTQIQGDLVDELSKKQPDQDKIAALHARLDETESERRELELKIRSEHPRYAGVRYSSPLKLAEVQSRLEDGSALLEYLVGEEGSYLFVVTRNGLSVYRLPAAERIAEKVQAVRNGIEQAGRRSSATYARAAHQLYQELMAPARPALAGKRHLLISPDGPLHFLSFEVLLTESGEGRQFADLPYLLRDFSTSYIPSASILSWLADPPYPAKAGAEAAKRFLAFADPVYGPEESGEDARQPARGAGPQLAATIQERGLGPMPRLEGTAREVQVIADLYPADEVQLYEREQANEENVKDNPLVETARRIHFATHGVVNKRQPELSGLRLTRTPGDDGLLQIHEIFDLDLRAELVVLSACDTGLGEEVTGEGLMGMTRAFLYAGTPSVVASLWQVADARAPDLMLGFYKDLDLTGDKAEALRQAKLGMIRGRSHARPYYWAPFILVGRP